MNAPHVSILIPVLNKSAFTRQCLDALRRHTTPDNYEVIVWDNGSTDDTPILVRQHAAGDARIRYFRSEENLGFVGGNNAAAEHARGRFLVLLNNDTEPQPGWLQALRQRVESDPTVGAVGAKLIYPDGKLQEAGGIIFRDGSGWNYGRMLDPHDSRFNFPREVDYCSAACLLVRADLFRRHGGFDLRYAPAYYEDTDLCFTLRQDGFRIVYEPRCEIVHHEGATAGQDLTKGFKQFQVRNRARFVEKWRAALAGQFPADAACVRRASNRARGQRILVIDPLLPMYDRASGSRRLFELLKLLVAGGNAITFIGRNGEGGERYAAELRHLGIEVYAGDPERMKECGCAANARPFSLERLLRDTDYDTVILSFWYIAEQYLRHIRTWSPRSRVIVDTVDVHFLRERRQAELAGDRRLLQHAALTFRRELGVYRKADAIIAVTDDDRRVLAREIPDRPIFVIPNIHDVAADVPGVENRNGCLFVGGFGHPPNEDAVLYFHREIWGRILQAVPHARLTIVGNNPPASVRALAGPAIDVAGYVPSVEPYLRTHLVSIAPLRYGAGMKGKIGEALAHGVPVVTTAIGAEGMGDTDGNAGMLVADDPQAFADQVAKLHADRDCWARLSAAAREHIRTRFTPDCVGRTVAAMLEWSSSLTSIIILAHNQWPHTARCLESISRGTPEPHEIIVVDNGSTDETPERLRSLALTNPRLRIISNRENRGFAAGNNLALAIACGDSVVLLNNDTLVTPGWLRRMLAVLQTHPDTGIVGPMSDHVSGAQQVGEAPCDLPAELAPFAERWAAAHAGELLELHRVVGFCLLARREVITAIGGLDERFGSGNFEDDDFCLRARLAGFRIRVAVDVFIHHVGSQTFKGAKIDYRQAMLRNWDLFRTKWRLPANLSPASGYPVPVTLPDGIPLRIALPNLGLTHQLLPGGRRWSDWAAGPGRPAVPSPATIHAPAVALLGGLEDANSLLRDGQHESAWEAALACIHIRPFHPDAYLLLAEIALAAGDGTSARRCARHARDLAPHHRRARKFLKRELKGNARPAWLTLPDTLQRDPAGAPRLSICLIVKNEERFIGPCLASIQGLAAQVVVIDTGSTDRTAAIARSQGAEVYPFTWADDFSAARNAALEHATGDWILVLDADEELPPSSHAVLREHLRDPAVMAWRLPIIDAGHEDEGCSFVPRLFRNAPGVHFAGRIHEHAFGSIEPLRREWGLENRLGRAELIHHGYTKEITAERGKVARNLRLLELALQETPGSPLLLMNLGLELGRSGRLDEALEQYRAAFVAMACEPSAVVVPELRETLLTQFTSHLLRSKQPAEVIQVLTSPLAAGAELTASLHYSLGLAYAEQRNFAAAAAQMRHCLSKRSQPNLTRVNPEVRGGGPRHCLALCHWRMQDAAAARREFEQASRENPSSVALHVDYARFLSESGASHDALPMLHRLVVEKPDRSAAWAAGARIALSQPDLLPVALDWTGVALEALPHDDELTAARAEALLLAGQPAEALPLWRKAEAGSKPPATAARILCEIALGITPPAPNAAEIDSISREFLRWYWRLVDFRAEATVVDLLENAEKLSGVLPAAAQRLRAIIAALNQPVAS